MESLDSSLEIPAEAEPAIVVLPEQIDLEIPPEEARAENTVPDRLSSAHRRPNYEERQDQLRNSRIATLLKLHTVYFILFPIFAVAFYLF